MTKTLKICFFNINAHSVFSPKSKAVIGGTEVQLFLLSRFLSANKNFKIDFITGDWGQDEHEKYGSVNVYKSISLDKKLSNYLKAPFVIWNKLRKINADIYIASSAGIEIGIIGLFCFLYHKKFIYRTAHDIDCSGEYSQRGFSGKAYDFGLKKASIVIVQKDDNQLMLEKNYGIKPVVIKNAFEIPPERKIVKDRYVLWVARCEKWKKPELFLNLAKTFPNFDFIMIAPKQKNQLEFFDQIGTRAKTLKNLKFVERVTFGEIQDYFNRAMLFVGTSEYEGFPNTYLQACLGKTPIISYKVNPDEFITKNNLGYCADGNFEKMIEQVKKILSDKNDWEEKSKNAYEYAKQNHDIEKIAKQWEEVIHKLAQN